MIYLFLLSVVPTVPAGWLTFAEGVVYKHYNQPVRVWGISPTDDQQLAGAIMKIGGSIFLWSLVVFYFFKRFATTWKEDNTLSTGAADLRRGQVGVRQHTGAAPRRSAEPSVPAEQPARRAAGSRPPRRTARSTIVPAACRRRSASRAARRRGRPTAARGRPREVRRELGERDDHAAEQQQHQVQPVLRGEVDLAWQACRRGSARCRRKPRADDDAEDGEQPVRRRRVPAEQRRRPAPARRTARPRSAITEPILAAINRAGRAVSRPGA